MHFSLTILVVSALASFAHCDWPNKKCECPLEGEAGQLTDEEIYQKGHKKPFGSHRPAEGMVDTLPYMISPEDFYMNYVVKHKPVVIKGGAKNWPAYTLWTDEYLIKTYGNVTFHMETKDDDKVNIPPDEKFSTFLKTYKERNRYLVDEVTPEMREEILLPLCLRCEEINRFFFVSYYWHSSGGTTSTIHIDTDENLLCVIRGFKRTRLVSPIYSSNLYADESWLLGVSPINQTEVDFDKYPRAKDVRYWLADASEGDCLYIPQMWWHQVDSLKGKQQAVAMWWKSKPFWKHVSSGKDGEKRSSKFEHVGKEYSFAGSLAEYEHWVLNVTDSLPPIRCNEQRVKMSNYHFETDKIENAPQTFGDGGISEEELFRQSEPHQLPGDLPKDDSHPTCDFDYANKKSPCHCRDCRKDEASLKCIRYTLDYCNEYEDRGCVISKPQLLNKLTGEDFQELHNVKQKYKFDKM